MVTGRESTSTGWWQYNTLFCTKEGSWVCPNPCVSTCISLCMHVFVCVCVGVGWLPQSTSNPVPVSGRGPAQMKSIFQSRTPTDSTRPTRWHTHTHTHRISTVKTLKLSYSTCINIDGCMHFYQDIYITLYSHKGTEHSWLKRMFHFSSSQHTQINCAYVWVCVCACACVCAITTSVCIFVCMWLAIRLCHLHAPIQDIRLTMLCETLRHISTQKIQWHES